jgi:hypothetical protein
MTPDRRSRNAAAELARARACLTEATTLAAAGMPYGAASRAYYAVFHGARALLFSAGIEPRSHRGVASLLGEHFVKPGRLTPDTGRLVARMQRDREDADYDTGAVFTDAQAQAMIADAGGFLAEVERMLAA